MSLSFIDVLSCGLGAAVFLFLLFSVMPHFGSGVKAAASKRSIGSGSIQISGDHSTQTIGLGSPMVSQVLNGGSVVGILQTEIEGILRLEGSQAEMICRPETLGVDLNRIVWHDDPSATQQAFADCNRNVVVVQRFVTRLPSQIELTFQPNALPANPTRISALLVFGDLYATHELSVNQATTQSNFVLIDLSKALAAEGR